MPFPKDPKEKKNQDLIQHFLREHGPLINQAMAHVKNHSNFPKGVIEDDDLHFAGFHGLMDAVHKYDHEVAGRLARPDENAFTKYALTRVKGKMWDHVKTHDTIPDSARRQAKNLQILENNKRSATTESAEPTILAAPTKPTED